MTMDHSTASTWRFALFITLIFAAVGVFGIMHHEMWLDEAHHFLLARDSSSFSEMAYNARYEGHPLLWNAMLFALTHFSSDPFWMQALNLSVSVIAVALFVRYAPFSKTIKVMVVFSYFILYEYSIISRNYSLAFLLLVFVCILFRERKKHFLLFSIALALLAQVHLFAATITGGFVLIILYEFFFLKERIAPFPFYAGSIIVLLSLSLVVILAIPPPDHFMYLYDGEPYLSFKRIGRGFSVLWKGLFPIQDFSNERPWNSNVITAFSKKAGVIPSILAWFVPAILLRKKRIALFFFYITACCIVLFIYFSPLFVAARHCGFFFLLLIAALWIATYFPDSSLIEKPLFVFFRRMSDKIAKPLFMTLLLIQVISGVYLYVVDCNRPFSNAKAVADWMIINKRDKDFIVINDHSTGPAICAYLGRNAYYAENNSEGSFCKWNTNPFIITQDTLFCRISRLLDSIPSHSLILVNSNRLRPFFPGKYPGIKPFAMKPLQTFSGALLKSENYTIYEFSRK
jgi:hypothetical protein